MEIAKNIPKLIRAFSTREMQLKLKAYEVTSNSFNSYTETFNNLHKLTVIKLSTPQEDVISVKDNIKLLVEKVKKLTEHRN
jgi:beta-lactam-binding protein with PASTA domain